VHTYYMSMALELAERAYGETSPNPMVGAVLVRGGRVVGRGWHRRAGQPHAEAEALAQAGENARGATCYVTLEPCSHHGRTPPCTRALIEAGVKKVVAAMHDPNPHVSGRGMARLDEAGIETAVGVLEERSRRLNRYYLKYITTGRPYVLLKLAASLDGKTATASGHSRWISGEESRRLVHYWRAGVDAVMVGAGTVMADDPLLTARHPVRGAHHRLLRVLVDGALRISPAARALKPGERTDTLVCTSTAAPPEGIDAMEKAGAEVLVLPDIGGGRVDPVALLDELGRRELLSVMVEGGMGLAADLLGAGLVDCLAVFLAPMFIGDEGRGMIGPLGLDALDAAPRAARLETRRVGADVLVKAYFGPGA